MITDIPSALLQYTNNLAWEGSTATAQAALQAVRYLLVNRAQAMNHQQTNLNYESLESEKKKLEVFLGIGSPRAFGRSRRVGMAFGDTGGLG